VPKGVTPAGKRVKPCYRRGVGRWTIITFLLLLAAGCQGRLGAVNVRWHIVDLTTGQNWDPRDVAKGGDCVSPDSPPAWIINKVQLSLLDISDGSIASNAIAVDPPFNCSQREATTSFTLPLGTFAMSLTVNPPDPDVVTPAPQVRSLKRGELVNLDVIELGVHPLPLVPFDGGLTAPNDAAAPVM
jgi:hypothetical protein